MPITEKDVSYVADLANLELTADERTRMAHDLSSILDYIGRLNELDTTGVPPMAQISDRFGASNVPGDRRFAYARRADTAAASLPHGEAMRNAPGADDTFFKVPKVIEK
ncbi:MAG TPA: Asp-tRNA(Asn)/Glu-tRNA(Gln) amidotransferase subunit GatC [Candidatus Saccharimonadales bacterium]|nr:Asp-tRNA(Asn)/Glu-tRNA(Gln) amidotransferase subunit GatC [Candidatus Saccharimonadales bacterium]